MAGIGGIIAGIVGAVESAGAAVAAVPAAVGSGISGLVGGGTLGGILGGAADFGLTGAGLGALIGGGEALVTGGKPLASALKGAEFGGLGGAALGGIGGGLGLVNFAGGAGAAGAGAGSPAAPIASAAPSGVPLGLPGGDITAFQGLDSTGGAALTGPAQGAINSQFPLDTSAGGLTAPAAGTQQATFNVGADSLDSSLGGQPIAYSNSAFGGTAADGTPLPPIRPAGLGTDTTFSGAGGGASSSGSQFAAGSGAGDPLSSAGGAVSQLGSSATNNVAGAASANSGSSILSGLGSKAAGGLTSLASNPGVLLAGGLVGLDALRANKKPPGETALLGEAATAQAQAAQLQSYQATGTLPPGIQTQLQSAKDAAAATIRSQYAARGMPGSSAEQQDLQALSDRMVGQGAQIATQLFNQGLSEAQFSAQLYEIIMNQATQQDAGLSSAIANLSSSLALAGTMQTRKAA
jgi:hypothetical protein